ncbi:MAG: tetratricopeptide repeat protein [Phycisphaerales bacterium]|nr:tetratricopeptide repeat protein [Phycisphaerales bacterium]
MTYDIEPTPAASWPGRKWWRLPMLGLGGAVVLAAVWTTAVEIGTPTVGETLQAAQQARDQSDLTAMQHHLDVLAGGVMETASIDELARYHALSGDWIWLRQKWLAISEQRNFERIASNYSRAEDLGLRLDAVREERWAMASIAIESFDTTMMLLDRMQGAESDDAAMYRRNRVQRAWLEAVHKDANADSAEWEEQLASYRDDAATRLEDMAWAMQHLARSRMEGGRVQEASQLLHADLRRLEGRSAERGETAPMGGLLVLLARCERDLGRYEEAERVLAMALDACPQASTERGDALVLQGELLAAYGLLEAAVEQFDLALIETPASASNMPALLHRGELRSMLGDHAGAMADFSRVVNLLESQRTHPDVDLRRIEGVLMDRSESAMLQNHLSESLAIAQLAWGLHREGDPPGPVANAVALAAGQLAQDAGIQLQAALEQMGTHDASEVAKLRARTISLHTRAAQASRAAANWWHDLPDEQERWRAALADIGRHEDAAGRTSQAIDAYQHAVDASISTDPRRVELMYALGQCLQVECRFDEAMKWYQRIIAERPGSPAATRSHVPLSRCYEALGHVDDAWIELQRIVEGDGVLTPEAADHREALFELGGLGYRTGRYTESLPWLDAFLAREIDEARVIEAQLLVSGCARGAARAIEMELTDGTPRSAGQCVKMESLRDDLLHRALEASMIVERATANPVTRHEVDLRRRALVDHGDTAWDLGLWSDAIRSYEQVARDYPDHPVSMHALVQVASAWVELGDRDRAESAHQRALRRLESMPDSNLAAVDSLLDREVWDRWMRVMPVEPALATGEEQ